MHYEYSYERSETKHIQGNEKKINDFLWRNREYEQIGGSNGSYIFAKPIKVRIIEYEDETSINPIRTIIPSLSFIIERREKRNVPVEKRYAADIKEIDLVRLVEDLNNGILNANQIV